MDLSWRPGTRAPHVWVEHAGQRISLLDLFDGRWVLLAGPDAADWHAAASEVAAERGLDLAAYRVGPSRAVHTADGAWGRAYGISPAGAVLVRPDGFVAWRSHGAAPAAAATLTRVLAGLLGARQPGTAQPPA